MEIVLHGNSPSMVLLRRIHKKVHGQDEGSSSASSGGSAATPMPDHPFEQVTTWFSPEADLLETNNDYQIYMELPGVPKESIELETLNGVLSVKGIKQPDYRTGDTSHRQERIAGNFARSFRVPEDSDPAAITASMTDGVLRITVPKPPTRSPLKINIS